jgi:hypothetical protein
MIKISRFSLIFLLFFSGCATASLLPKSFEVSDDDQMQGRMLLLNSMQRRDPQNHWAELKFMKVVAKDEWSSQSARSATPIPERLQQLQFAFNLNNDGAFMKFLDGKKRGDVIGIEHGKTFFVTKGKRQEKSSQPVNRYLPLVRNYFLWPQTIHDLQHIAYLGEADHGLRRYYKILAANGADLAGADQQFIVWINRQTLQIEYIEYHSTESGSLYRGVVQYRDYRDVDGVMVPYEIILLDEIDRVKYSHKYSVQILTLE